MDVYSFQDFTLTLEQEGYPTLSTVGQGIGEATVTYTDNKNESNVASDGVTVFSKIRSDVGGLSVSMQQTSSLHKLLIKRFNDLYYADNTTDWASMNGILKNKSTGEQKILKGIAFQKIPDNAHGRTAGMVTWEFDVAYVSTNII